MSFSYDFSHHHNNEDIEKSSCFMIGAKGMSTWLELFYAYY